jgi:hypothetical protein
MNTRSTETCVNRDAISNDSFKDSYNHASLVATNDEHLSLVAIVPEIGPKLAATRAPVRYPGSGRLFQQILFGMGCSLVVLVMVIATTYSEHSLMQGPAAGTFIYQQLIG